MTGSIERHSHLAVTRQTEDGTIVHTDVHVTASVTTMSAAVTPVHPDPALRLGVQPDALAGAALRTTEATDDATAASVSASVSASYSENDDDAEGLTSGAGGACFDPDTCCDARERALIMAMRAYLRPDVAPECLMRRLRATLDRCCCDPDGRS